MGRQSTAALVSDRALAERLGDTRYWAEGEKCGSCGGKNPVFYVEDPGTCVDCYAAAWRESLPDGHPTGRRACLIAGLPYWVDQIPKLCRNAPHGLRHDPDTDRCVTCEEQRRRDRLERRVTGRGRTDGRYREVVAPPMERQAARSLGFTHYTGAPCARGHAGVRYVSTGGCVACLRGA